MRLQKIFLLIILTFLINFTSIAQNNYNVSGKVVDKAFEAIPFSLVILTSLTDSSIQSAYSDIEGAFKLELLEGLYTIDITVVGYENYKDTLSVKQNIRLKNIVLSTGTTELQEVKIVAEKSTMQMKLDKKVYNVGSDPNNEGANASEIIENVPSVTVDGEGNVQLRGSQNVRILINGKPSGLTSMGSADALQLLQGNMIESIEVITNPSSKYDAAGSTGIINIVLKRNRRKGIDGSFQLNSGWPDNHGAGVNLSWGTKNVNWTLATGLGYRKYPAEGGEQTTYSGDTSFVFERDRNQIRGGGFGNFQLGADIQLDSSNTLSVLGSYIRKESPNTLEIVYRDFNAEDVFVSSTSRNEEENEVKENMEFGIGHLKKFKKSGKTWSSDLNWYNKTDLEDATIEELSLNQKINQRSSNTENEMSFLGQTDFVFPLGESMKLETGLRNIYRKVDNNFKVEELDETDVWNQIPSFTDDIGYKENVSALYLQYSKEWDKISLSSGLRNEYSMITVTQSSNNANNNKNYNDIFPSIHTSYKVDSTTTVQLSYSKRINRPSFRSLLPFYSFSDTRSQYGGNPDLNPEYIHSFEFSYLKYWSKVTLLSSLYYRRENGAVQRITFVDEETIIRTIPVNLDLQHSYGFELNLNVSFFDWWKLSGNGNVFYANISGDYQDITYNNEALIASGQIQNNFDISKTWSLNILNNYRAPQKTTQGRSLAISFMNITANHQFWNKKAKLSFGVRDVFRQRVYNRIVDEPGFYRDSFFRPRQRMFLLSFNYKFTNNNPNKIKTRSIDDGE